MKRSAWLLAASTIPGLLAGPALAAFPEQAVRIIVPFSAGGSTDLGARIWALHLQECLGGTHPVIVQNQPGASGQLGFVEIANAAPDGYTIGLLNVPNLPLGTITRSDATYTLDSFDYLGSLYGSRTTLSVRRNGDIESLEQLIDKSRQNGEPITIGISAIGSDDHLLALKLADAADIEINTIPFGDAAAINNALLGGHVDVATLNITLAAMTPDEVRALAVASEQPVDSLPGVPTFREAGFDIINGTTHVIGAPAGLSQEAFDKLSSCFVSMSQNPAFTADIERIAFVLNPMDAEGTKAFVDDETALLTAIWEADPWQ